jgi:ubiquinone/menaquinone biosynthesis C-methylase UbiE
VSELQHPRARSFERVAELYERQRPEYPPEVVAWLRDRLGLRAGRTVLDLGAGTGKLTRALVRTGARVLALEPGDAMRTQLELAVPDAVTIAAGAESIPLPDASVDAVTAGAAFHWFRFDEAVREVHRVLRPAGGLGLVWNARDSEDPLQREIGALIAPFVPPGSKRETPWPDALEATGLFGATDAWTSTFADELDADGLVERMATVSFVAAAPNDARRALERGLRRLAAARGGRVPFRYVTRAYVTFSVA